MPVLLKKNYSLSTANVEEEIARRLRHGETASFLYIVPTKRKVRDLQREFLSSVPGRVASTFHLFTFETLAARLFGLLCKPKRLVSRPVQAVLVQEAIRSVESSLSYVKLHGENRSLPPGTFRKIIDVIDNLKESGVYLPVLIEELEKADPSEKGKLSDILTIYEKYEHLLGDRFIDVPGMMKELNLQWETPRSDQIFGDHFTKCHAIFVAGFDEFSDPELTMLYHLSEIRDIGTLVAFDYHPNNDEVFGHLKENYRKLLDMGFTRETSHPGERSKFQSYIAEHLFLSRRVTERLDSTDSITVVRAEDREHEVELIAKLIKELVRKKPDRDLSKICVAMHRPQIYTSLFREVFAEYGIPANITDRYHLNQSPFIISLLSLFLIEERNYRLVDIMRALSSPYCDFHYSGGVIDPGNLYTVASLLKIAGGRSSWLRRIEGRLSLISQELHSSDDDSAAARFEDEKEMLEKARADITALGALLRRFASPMTPPEFKLHVVRLLEELRVVGGILVGQTSDPDRLEIDARAYQKFMRFLDEFLQILAIEGKGNEPLRLSFYTDRLRQTIAEVRYNVRQKYGYGVYVTSMDETRGLHVDIMFIAGLVDGEFPPVYRPEIFFSSPRQESKERYHLREHRYLFYQAATNFTEHLFLTLPKNDGDKTLVPSSFLESLRNVITLDDPGEELVGRCSRLVYSEDELLRFAGEQYGRDGGDCSHLYEKVLLSAELRQTLDHMRIAISAEQNRLNGSPLPAYDGQMSGQLGVEARKTLEAFRDRVFSVTQLESYGRCPFQFFADRVLRLHAVPDVEEGLTPMERGGILHEILYEFFSERRDNRLPPLSRTTDEEFQRATGRMLAIAKRKLDELNVSELFWDIDKEKILGTANRKGVVQEFLEAERNREVETVPTYFEVAFGSAVDEKKNTDPTLTYPKVMKLNGVLLRGRIDRIDVGKECFTIIDYKSSTRVAGRREIDLGMSLQLPIYLNAVERILAETDAKGFTGAAGTYYLLQSPVREKLGIGNAEFNGKAFPKMWKSRQLLPNAAELRSIINQAVAFVNDYVDNIARGNFPVKPKRPEEVCTYCDFKTICRIQLQRDVNAGNPA